MKITINLTDAEVKGIKKFHREIFDEKLDKAGIQEYIANIVSGNLHAPQESVSDYINQFENQ